MTKLEDLMGRSVRIGNLRIKEQRFFEHARMLFKKYYSDCYATCDALERTPEQHTLGATLDALWEKYKRDVIATASYRSMHRHTYEFEHVKSLKTRIDEYRTKSFGAIIGFPLAPAHCEDGLFVSYQFKGANIVFYEDERDIMTLRLLLL